MPGGLKKGQPSPRQAANDKFHNFKVCSRCGENKRLADFSFNSGWKRKLAADPTRYRKRCKKCSRAPSAAADTPGFNAKRAAPRKRLSDTERRSREARYKRRKRRVTRVKALEYLAEKGCCECGTHDPRVLEFDHIEPCDKEHAVSRLLCDGYSWGTEKLRAEIRKCRVICANCHRKHTIIQQEHYAHKDVAEALQNIYDRYGIK